MPATIDWIVNFIGPEGYRESFKVTTNDAADLAERRENTLSRLTSLGAVSDVRKLFESNDTKPGKLAAHNGESKGPSKLDKLKQPPVAQEETVSPMERAALDTFEPQSGTVSDTVNTGLPKIEPIRPEEYGFRQKNNLRPVENGVEFEKPISKLARFQPKQTEAPAEKPVVASATNVPPKLARFVAREKPAE